MWKLTLSLKPTPVTKAQGTVGIVLGRRRDAVGRGAENLLGRDGAPVDFPRDAESGIVGIIDDA